MNSSCKGKKRTASEVVEAKAAEEIGLSIAGVDGTSFVVRVLVQAQIREVKRSIGKVSWSVNGFVLFK